MKNLLFNNFLSKWFFVKYYGIPKTVEIFKISKTSVHYWTDKENFKAQCREYNRPIFDFPLIKHIKYCVLFLPFFLKIPLFFFALLTDNTATNNRDSVIKADAPTTKFGADSYLEWFLSATAVPHRSVMNWTLPAGSGVISEIALYGYVVDLDVGDSRALGIYTLTRDFVEADVTWNKYNSTTNWTRAGGDFNSTVIDTIAQPSSTSAWIHLHLTGAEATNPIIATWGDTIMLLLKYADESDPVAKGKTTINSKEAASEKPYILITYTVAAAGRNQCVII